MKSIVKHVLPLKECRQKTTPRSPPAYLPTNRKCRFYHRLFCLHSNYFNYRRRVAQYRLKLTSFNFTFDLIIFVSVWVGRKLNVARSFDGCWLKSFDGKLCFTVAWLILFTVLFQWCVAGKDKIAIVGHLPFVDNSLKNAWYDGTIFRLPPAP